jgi:hypothetical protein
MSTTDIIVPDPAAPKGAIGLSALIKGLQGEKRVAIVRFVKRKNGAPQLGVLTPCKYTYDVCLGTQ